MKQILFILRPADQLKQNALAHYFPMAKFQLLNKINTSKFLKLERKPNLAKINIYSNTETGVGIKIEFLFGNSIAFKS